MRSDIDIAALKTSLEDAVDRRPDDEQAKAALHALEWVFGETSDEFMQLYVDDPQLVDDVTETCE